MTHEKGHGRKVTIDVTKKTLLVGALVLVFALSIVRVYYMNTFNADISGQVSAIKEVTKPVSLQIVKLVDSSCTDCFDIGQIATALQQFNVNITGSTILEITSPEAKEMITKFGIETAPALIITGDIDNPNIANLWQQVGRVSDKTVIIDAKDFPPYKNLTSGKVEGHVALIVLNDSSCVKCYDVNAHDQVLPRFGITPVSKTVYDVSSAEGKALVNKYNITNVPTIVLSPDAKVYPNLVQVWTSVGSIESDGWFIFRTTEQMGTYKNMITGNVSERTQG